jgi:hypothetical protein
LEIEIRLLVREDTVLSGHQLEADFYFLEVWQIGLILTLLSEKEGKAKTMSRGQLVGG